MAAQIATTTASTLQARVFTVGSPGLVSGSSSLVLRTKSTDRSIAGRAAKPMPGSAGMKTGADIISSLRWSATVVFQGAVIGTGLFVRYSPGLPSTGTSVAERTPPPCHDPTPNTRDSTAASAGVSLTLT